MIFSSASKALRALADPAMRGVLWKTLGLTILALIALWFAIASGVTELALPWVSDMVAFNYSLPEWTGWISLFTAIAAGIALAAGLAFLIGPASALIAGLFLDDAAEHLEKAEYPSDPPGKALPIVEGVWLSVKFAGVVVLGNLLALALLLVPGINLIAFFVVNGYLLGREYFEFAARRFGSEETVRALRSKYSGTIFGAGLVLAAFLAVPVVNLLTPLFGAAMMVHLHKAIAAKEAARTRRSERVAA
ncbi:sulfate transporter family protein [Oricola cellulosilytica]|uniref:Sulfate transporter family protein n=1 Tax=Oricola cellulosilytica TaxID=1429082 RepID=A0A4R0PG34_9HYPH|nr:sulfate transporter family protein [Oricola cellulosilytica]TCD16058.1 sulfate transporter family protein [Oricola cellulosilytica]